MASSSSPNATGETDTVLWKTGIGFAVREALLNELASPIGIALASETLVTKHVD
jgi:hypothetical protein